MGFGVAVALLFDATLIRSIVLPCTLSVLGERSWYLPRWLNWLPRIEAETSQSAPGTDDASRVLVSVTV
jgi:RND superfamily putative drug exporter